MNNIIYLFLLITIAYGDMQLDIYNNAKKYIGEKYWAKDKERQAKGNEHVFFNKGDWKCNLFVYEMILDSGYDIGTPNELNCFRHPILCFRDQLKRPPCVTEWKNEEVPGFVLIGEGDEGRNKSKKGDIIAADSHVGIVSKNKKTISATDKEIVENDWGFRGEEEELKVFRYVGDE